MTFPFACLAFHKKYSECCAFSLLITLLDGLNLLHLEHISSDVIKMVTEDSRGSLSPHILHTLSVHHGCQRYSTIALYVKYFSECDIQYVTYLMVAWITKLYSNMHWLYICNM